MKKIKYLLLVFFVCIGINNIYSQKTPPPPPQTGDTVTPPPGLPIDSGLAILLVCGIAYGTKKVRN
ncbi:PID-CTERM protein-sorting domain-containing protein [Polaribacter sargassicola]|uniref:PID-CTERM protein-sorting domain-containing protein n=1 Tax=Polaribacter sargassicola TaxID=2836891 RepID=UPI001F477157|nr:hypothetical protein [Polaribacter sp. DS7-9]MCG1037396.1 hypothetical protein [Polaribacter sp. DS7-9]